MRGELERPAEMIFTKPVVGQPGWSPARLEFQKITEWPGKQISANCQPKTSIMLGFNTGETCIKTETKGGKRYDRAFPWQIIKDIDFLGIVVFPGTGSVSPTP